MFLTGCLLAAAAAAPQETPPTAAFRLGPAAAAARLEHVDGKTLLVVTVTNDTDSPLWWRGAGLGCVGSSIPRAPVDAEGRERPEFGASIIGCTMEKDRPPTAAQLSEWRIEPGASVTETLRPFWDLEENDTAPHLRAEIPRLAQWIFEHEFTLPRATPPPGTMDFDCPQVAFAFHRSLGLCVFVDEVDGDVHLLHFDPFDPTPFLRDGPAPVHVGPLIGTLTLDGGERPTALLRLRNPGASTVTWQPRLTAEALRFAPGGEHLIPLAPFEEAGDAAPAPDARWHRVLVSTWPVVGGEDAAGARPAALLHLVFDPRNGAAAGLTQRREKFHGFFPYEVRERASAATPCGDAWILATVERGVPGSLAFRLLCTAEQYHWRTNFADMDATEEFRWADAPAIATPIAWHEPRPALDLSKPGSRMNWFRNAAQVGEFSASHDRAPPWWKLPYLPEGASHPAWEWRRVILVPRAEPPSSTSGLEAVLLTARWSPEAGLQLATAPAPPAERD